MMRRPRPGFAGAWHHVMNRGGRHAPIFEEDHDCLVFLDLMAETVDQFGPAVHAFALMPNHYHLLVCSVRCNLSEAMPPRWRVHAPNEPAPRVGRFAVPGVGFEAKSSRSSRT